MKLWTGYRYLYVCEVHFQSVFMVTPVPHYLHIPRGPGHAHVGNSEIFLNEEVVEIKKIIKMFLSQL